MKNVLDLFKVLALIAVVACFTACDDDDSSDPQTITDIAADNDQFSTLVAALQRVGLDETLRGGTFTVFAPTNQAFIDANITDLDAFSDEELTNILLYHVIAANVPSTDLADGDNYPASENKTGPGNTAVSLYVSKVNGAVTVNGNANVTSADIEASNGVIHQVNRVLLPMDVVDHAIANPAFSSLVAALTGATEDLVGTLQGDGPFTVFAPVNSAFDAAAATINSLDDQTVTNVLKHHVASGNVLSGTLTNGQRVTGLSAGDFTINIDNGNVTITSSSGNVANVLRTDVQGTNGVIHVIDQVIVPSL